MIEALSVYREKGIVEEELFGRLNQKK